MLVVGLTGSIAMGKSHTVRHFRGFGVPVFDADQAVHALFRFGSPLVQEVDAIFPDCLDKMGNIDRRKLGVRVFGDELAFKRLEALVHPKVAESQRKFLKTCARQQCPLAVLDIPLLYETGAERRLDAVVVCEAHPEIQRQRALARSGMTALRFAAILEKQLSAAEKRKRGDFVIYSGYDRGATVQAVAHVLRLFAGRTGRAWPARWCQ